MIVRVRARGTQRGDPAPARAVARRCCGAPPRTTRACVSAPVPLVPNRRRQSGGRRVCVFRPRWVRPRQRRGSGLGCGCSHGCGPAAAGGYDPGRGARRLPARPAGTSGRLTPRGSRARSARAPRGAAHERDRPRPPTLLWPGGSPRCAPRNPDGRRHAPATGRDRGVAASASRSCLPAPPGR